MRRPPLSGRRSAFAVALVLVALGCAGEQGSPSPAAITISTAPGERLAFDPAQATVTGPGMVEITFRNGSALAHNLVFTGTVEAGTRTIVEPDTEDEVVVDLSARGAYPFVCTIHDGMAGEVIVR